MKILAVDGRQHRFFIRTGQGQIFVRRNIRTLMNPSPERILQHSLGRFAASLICSSLATTAVQSFVLMSRLVSISMMMHQYSTIDKMPEGVSADRQRYLALDGPAGAG
jgi:hypothetical protein